ncbi:MAG TPA: hypothetical protein PKC49_04130, partial [Phycisphaerae bacterium]|nr:hypothetical protein [Phycisphaerae bacterium]
MFENILPSAVPFGSARTAGGKGVEPTAVRTGNGADVRCIVELAFNADGRNCGKQKPIQHRKNGQI